MIFAVQLTHIPAPLGTLHLANGVTVSVDEDRGGGIYTQSFASTLDLYVKGRKRAHLRTRDLITEWLAKLHFSDRNELRYLDNAGRLPMLQGFIGEVVPFQKGILLRMELINMGPSSYIVTSDFILRWTVESPSTWSIVDRSIGAYQFGHNVVKLPKLGVTQYLISDSGIYRLEGPAQRSLVAKFPHLKGKPQYGWFCHAQRKGLLIIACGTDFPEPNWRYFSVNLRTGRRTALRLTPPS